MPPIAILDPSELDFSKIIINRDQIRERNPQRFEFELIDAVIYLNEETRVFAGYHDLKPDGWWVRGHIPGRPLYPGVLMIETAAQLCGLFAHHSQVVKSFMGFGGVDGVKFRGAVVPPARFVVVGRAQDLRPRRVVCEMQGFVNGTMVFEGTITGMPL